MGTTRAEETPPCAVRSEGISQRNACVFEDAGQYVSRVEQTKPWEGDKPGVQPNTLKNTQRLIQNYQDSQCVPGETYPQLEAPPACQCEDLPGTDECFLTGKLDFCGLTFFLPLDEAWEKAALQVTYGTAGKKGKYKIEPQVREKPVLEKYMHKIQLPKLTKENAKLWLPKLLKTGEVDIPLPKIMVGTKEVPVPKLHVKKVEFTLPELIVGQKWLPVPKLGVAYKKILMPTAEIVLKDVKVPELVLTYMNIDVLNLLEKQDVKLPKLIKEFEEVPVPKLVTHFLKITGKRLGVESHIDIALPKLEQAYKKVPVKKLVLSGYRSETIRKLVLAGKLFVTLPQAVLQGKKEFPVLHIDHAHKAMSVGKPKLEWVPVAIPKLVQTGWKNTRFPKLHFQEGELQIPKKEFAEKNVTLPVFLKHLATKEISTVKPGMSNFTLYKLAMENQEVPVPKVKLFGYRNISLFDFGFESVDLSLEKLLRLKLVEIEVPRIMLDGYEKFHIPRPGVKVETLELSDGKKIQIPVKVSRKGAAVKVPTFSVQFVKKKIPLLKLVDSEDSLKLRGIVPVFRKRDVPIPDIAIGHQFVDMKKLGYVEKNVPYATLDNGEWVPVKEVPVVARTWKPGNEVTVRVFQGWTPEEKTVTMVKQGFQDVEVPTMGIDIGSAMLPVVTRGFKDVVVKTSDIDFKYIEVPDIGFEDGKRIIVPQVLWKNKTLLIPELDYATRDKVTNNFYLNSSGKDIKVHQLQLEPGREVAVPIPLLSTRNKTVGVYRVHQGRTALLPTWQQWKVPVVGIKKRDAQRPALDYGMKSVTIPMIDIKASDLSVPIPFLIFGKKREFLVPHVQLDTVSKSVPFWEVGVSNVSLKLGKYELKNAAPTTVPILRKSEELWEIRLPWVREGPALKNFTTIAKVPKCIDRKHTTTCVTVEDLLDNELYVKFLMRYLLIPRPLATDQLVDTVIYTTLDFKGRIEGYGEFAGKEYIIVRFAEYWEQQGFLSNRARLMTIAGDVLCENTGKVIVPNVLPCQSNNESITLPPNHVAHVVEKVPLPAHLFPTVLELVCDSHLFPDLSIYCQLYGTAGVGIPGEDGERGCMQKSSDSFLSIFAPYVLFAPVDVAWEQFLQTLSAAAATYKAKAHAFQQILHSRKKNLDEFFASLEDYREASGWKNISHSQSHYLSDSMMDWFHYWDPEMTKLFLKVVEGFEKFDIDLAELSLDSLLSSPKLICEILQYNSIVKVGREGSKLNDLSSRGPGGVNKCNLQSGIYVTALVTDHEEELDCTENVRNARQCRLKIKLSNRGVSERLCGEPFKARHLVGRTVVSGRINSADILVPNLQAGVFPNGNFEEIPPVFDLRNGELLGQTVAITDAVLIPPTLVFGLTLYDIVCDPLQTYLSIFCAFVQASAELGTDFMALYKNQAIYIDGTDIEDQRGGNGLTVFAVPNDGILETMAILPQIPNTVDALLEEALQGGRISERFILEVLGFHTIQKVFYPWELHDSETLVTTSQRGETRFFEIVVRIQGQKAPVYSRNIRLVSECNYVTVVAPPPAYFPVAINGIVGIVDRVLIPPRFCLSACEILEINPLTNIYTASIYALNLYRDICDGSRSACIRRKTLLAPTDGAWGTALAQMNISRNQLFTEYSELLYDTVMTSVIPNRQYVTDFRARNADNIFENQDTLPTVLSGYTRGTNIMSLREDSTRNVMGWMSSRIYIQDCRPRGCREPDAPEGCTEFGFPPAQIVVPNLLAADGVVQVIDKVLFPCKPFECVPPTFTYTPESCSDLPCSPPSPLLQTAETSIRATVTYTSDPSCNLNCFDWFCSPCSPLKAQTIVAVGGFRPQNPLKAAVSQQVKFGLRGWDEFFPEKPYFLPADGIHAALVVYINQLGEVRFGVQPYLDYQNLELFKALEIIPGPSIVAEGFLARTGETFTVLATYSASCRLAKIYINGVLRGAASVNWLAAVDFTDPVTVGGGNVNTDNAAGGRESRDLVENSKGSRSSGVGRRSTGITEANGGRDMVTANSDSEFGRSVVRYQVEALMEENDHSDYPVIDVDRHDHPSAWQGQCQGHDSSTGGQCSSVPWSYKEELMHEHAAMHFASNGGPGESSNPYREAGLKSRGHGRRLQGQADSRPGSASTGKKNGPQAGKPLSATASSEDPSAGVTIGGPDPLVLRQMKEDLNIFNSSHVLDELLDDLKGLSVGEMELYMRNTISQYPFYSLFDGQSDWELDPPSTHPEFLKELKWWAYCGPKYDQYSLAPRGAWGNNQNYPYAACGISAVVYGTFLGHIHCIQIFDEVILYPSTASCPCES